MVESQYPYSKAKFSDDEGAVSTSELRLRLRWAVTIGLSMGLVALVMFWAADFHGLVELSVIGLLCGVMSLHAIVSGIDLFAELRGRTFVDTDG